MPRPRVPLVALWLGALLLVAPAVAAPPRPDAARATLLMKAGRFGEAAALLSPLARLNPQDANYHYRLGTCLWRTGDLSGAAEAYRRAALAKPKEAIYPAALARLYVQAGQPDRASYWYRKLLLLRPGHMRLTTEAAQYAMQQGQPLQAELLLKRALARNPKDADGWTLLGQCYQRLRLKAEAAQCFEKAAAAKPPTLAQLRQIIALYTAGGQPDRALPYLQLAQRLRPRDAALQAQIADCYLAVNDNRSAIAAYRQAAQFAPRKAEYRLALAELLAPDAPAAALAEFDRAFALEQPTAELLLTASSLAAKAGDNAAALRYLTRLVALRPRAVEPREMLVQTALVAGDRTTAVQQWRELQRAGEPRYAVEETELALKLGARGWASGRLAEVAKAAGDDALLLARLASLSAQLDDTPQALALVDRALLASGNDPDAQLLAAQVLLQVGETERAETLFRRIYEEQPSRLAAVQGLAECLLKRDEARSAYDMLQGIVRQKPRDAGLAQTFVEAAEQAGEMPRAATLLAEMLQLDPDNEAFLDALAHLYRRQGGEALAARRLLTLSDSAPRNGSWALMAARELVAAKRWQDAAAIYERLAKGSEYTVGARVGLCQLLLAEEKYPELLETLARLTGPQAIGPEAYRLLLQVRSALVLQGGKLDDLPAIAQAAVAVCLSDLHSQTYYLALADLYLATKQTAPGVAYLQAQAATRGQPAGATVALARLLRKLNRPQEALVWLNQSAAANATSAAVLERAECLLQAGQPLDAAALAEQVLRDDDLALRPQAHLIAAEGCIKGLRPEEALWHYCAGLRGGGSAAVTVPAIIDLCSRQPLDEVAVTNALQQLYAEGYTQPALEVADALSQKPGYGALKRWSYERAR